MRGHPIDGRRRNARCECGPPNVESLLTASADWRKVPFYVVGAATAVAVSQIHCALPTRACFAPAEANVRGGAEAGTGERLAAFILKDLGDDGLGRNMLYLTGDKNRETLPELLAGGGVTLETVEVYRTTGSSTFRADLEAAVERAATLGELFIQLKELCR